MRWNHVWIAIFICALLTQVRPAGAAQEATVPKGELTKYEFANSTIFPNTVREYWIYVPKQYDPAKPACLVVGQDGVGYNAPDVLDKLIAAGEIPVMIGVFVRPGSTRSFLPDVPWRPNRSYEYDSVNDRYVRFLLEEMLPEVERQKTADGRPIRISKDGNDHMIMGASSGGIAAFNAAWQRPEAFSRVYSSVGSYVNLRGGNDFPNLVRKCEPKPIRAYLQSGTHDARFLCGDWWMANQEMERALSISGYDVNHTFGEGDHGSPQMVEIFPDVMRWLWRDWPAPVKAGAGSEYLQAVALPGEPWRKVAEGYGATGALAADAQGRVVFNDLKADKTYRLDAAGQASVLLADAHGATSLAYAPDGRLIMGSPARQSVLACTAEGKLSALAEKIQVAGVTVLRDGSIYATEYDPRAPLAGKLWLLRGGEKVLVAEGLEAPNAIGFSPEQHQLYVGSATTKFVLSYLRKPDGGVGAPEPYYVLETPYEPEPCGTTDVHADGGKWVYSATRLGVQVSDEEGRVVAVLNPPTRAALTSMCFGGPGFDTLYVTSGGEVYARKVKVKGATAF